MGGGAGEFMILDILKFPEPILRVPARPVEAFTGEIAELMDNMLETMYAAPGIGLAAPQVGVSTRVIVLDLDHENRGANVIKLANPEVREAEGEVVYEEGCLSVVDFTAEVKRAERVLVGGYGADGEEVEIEADGLLAVALQHEIDHLDGKLFIDRISRLKRDIYVRKLKKAIRTGKEPEESRGVVI